MLPRVLVLTNRYPNPCKIYAAIHVERHVSLHKEAGLRVTVIAPPGNDHGLLKSIWRHVVFGLRVLRVLFSAQFDIIHAHWPLPAGLGAAIIAGIRRRPFVLTSHGAFVDDFARHPWLIRTLTRLAFRSADEIIAVGEQHQNNITSVTGIAKERLHLISMGVWREETVVSQVQARGMLNRSLEQKVVVFIGNLEFVKGPDILIEAVATLSESIHHFQLIIGGQGSMEHDLLKMVRQLKVEQVVSLIGPISPENVFTWLTAADICVVPSRSESFGLVAVEAMACGTAVIAADVGGLREKIKHRENGLLFPVEDCATLTHSLQELLIDNELRNQIAERGKQTAAVYDMRLQAAKVRAVYLDLLSKMR